MFGHCHTCRDPHPDRRALAPPASVARIGPIRRDRPCRVSSDLLGPPAGFPLIPPIAPFPTVPAAASPAPPRERWRTTPPRTWTRCLRSGAGAHPPTWARSACSQLRSSGLVRPPQSRLPSWPTLRLVRAPPCRRPLAIVTAFSTSADRELNLRHRAPGQGPHAAHPSLPSSLRPFSRQATASSRPSRPGSPQGFPGQVALCHQPDPAKVHVAVHRWVHLRAERGNPPARSPCQHRTPHSGN